MFLICKMKILYAAPNYYGFNDVVFAGFQNFANGHVSHLIINGDFKYRNFGERVENFFSKVLLNRNLKKIRGRQRLSESIKALELQDLIVVNRHDMFTPEQISLLRSKASRMVAVLWDSIDKIPQQTNYLEYFDNVFSFDRLDCESFGFRKINNFYFAKKEFHTSSFDVGFLGSFDSRFPDLLKFRDYFENNNVSLKARIFDHHPEKLKITAAERGRFMFSSKIIPFSTSFNFYNECSIILDLGHPHQRGLSFRPFEAIGLKKKLITNNPEVLLYDFYDENNIHLVTDMNHISIPKDFFTTKYKDLPEELTEKYYIKHWIENILQNA